MKPVATPYDRNSKLCLKLLTVNPCNQFIIQNLLRWKINVTKKGLNQFHTYNLSIESVRKYSLPLLCYQQMVTLEGFGKFFCTTVCKLIRKHYQRGRLPTLEEKDFDDREHQEDLRREMRRLKSGKDKGEDDQEQVEEGEGIDQEQQNDNQQNSNSSNSQQPSKPTSHPSHPPPNKPTTETYQILKAITQILKQKSNNPNIPANQKNITNRGEINQQLFHWKMDKVRSWGKLCEKLREGGYVRVDGRDGDVVGITMKGRDYLVELEKEAKGQPEPNHIIIFRKQKLNPSTPTTPTPKLHLTLNTKGSFKTEQSLITTLTQDQSYNINQAQFQFASVLWMLDTKILDYMVLRFKMDSFQLGEFNGFCQRARNSCCGNVWILLEWAGRKGKGMGKDRERVRKEDRERREEICGVIGMARAAGFKVIQCYGMAETIKFLKALTDGISHRIQQVNKGQQMLLLGTLQVYNQKNKKLLPICLKQITKKFLKCIPKIHRTVIECLSQKLPTFAIAHNYMQRLRDRNERLQFLRWMFAELTYRAAVVDIYHDLLFQDVYEGEGQGEEGEQGEGDGQQGEKEEEMEEQVEEEEEFKEEKKKNKRKKEGKK